LTTTIQLFTPHVHFLKWNILINIPSHLRGGICFYLSSFKIID
jgi:hypothetical protein